MPVIDEQHIIERVGFEEMLRKDGMPGSRGGQEHREGIFQFNAEGVPIKTEISS